MSEVWLQWIYGYQCMWGMIDSSMYKTDGNKGNTEAGVYCSRYVWVLRCKDSLMYECVLLWVWVSVCGLSKYISLMSFGINDVHFFVLKPTQLDLNSPGAETRGSSCLTECWHSLFFLSMLTVKGLSILKVQLVMVIEIDQHVLYWFVCKA